MRLIEKGGVVDETGGNMQGRIENMVCTDRFSSFLWGIEGFWQLLREGHPRADHGRELHSISGAAIEMRGTRVSPQVLLQSGG